MGRNATRLRMLAAALGAASVAAVTVLATVAGAQATQAPQSTSAPTIEGTLQEGKVLTAGNGIWTNAPDSYTYRWQRCDPTGAACADIAGETDRTYTLAAADTGRTVRVVVTAKN